MEGDRVITLLKPVDEGDRDKYGNPVTTFERLSVYATRQSRGIGDINLQAESVFYGTSDFRFTIRSHGKKFENIGIDWGLIDENGKEHEILQAVEARAPGAQQRRGWYWIFTAEKV